MAQDETAVTLVGLTYPFRGGISHYTTMLYKALEKAHRVSLINFKRQYPSFLFPGRTQLDQSDVTFGVCSERIIDSVNPLTWLRAFWRITKHPSDLVIFQWWHPFFGLCFGTIAYLLKIFTRRRIVFICHNVIPHERHWVDRMLTRFALSSADKLVVHGRQQADQARRILPRANIACHPHPLYDQFHLLGISQHEARDRLSVEGKVLLFVGYIRPYKGLPYLLEALPEVLREIEVTLVVAGEFYERKARYQELIHSLDLAARVKLIDRYIPNEEVETYFSACDAVVCPYVSGSQSGVVQIAYSFHKPVICTRVAALPEVIVEGKTGFVVNPADPQDLARGILDFYTHQNEEDFSRHISNAKERFTWDGLIQTIRDV